MTLTVTSARVTEVDSIDITASGAVNGTQSSAAKGSQQLPVTVALRLPSDASGALHLDVVGRQTGSVVGIGSTDGTITPGKHNSMTVDLEAASGMGDDMGVGDDSGDGADLSGMQPSPDLAMNPDTPRLLSPLSTAVVTSKRPVLKWTIPSGVGTPAVDICSDAACGTILATATITGSQAVPTTDLPYGPAFWRVRATLGSDTKSSATWEFFVPSHAVSSSINVGTGSVFDANRDGLADAVFGEPGYLVMNKMVGRIYVVVNAAGTGLPTTLPTPIESPEGPGGGWGNTVSSADVNGDGFADLVVGAPHLSSGVAGVVYVYFGGTTGLNLNSPQVITSPLSTAGGGFGASVAGAGDVNGDGYGDVVVGESQAQIGGATNAGRFYVFYGGAGGLMTTAGSFTSVDGFDGANAGLGSPVLGGGDIDGDGYGDILVAAQSALDGGSNVVGRVYAYRGGSSGLVKTTPFATLQGTVANGSFGHSIAMVDLNNDGYSDAVVGAFGENTSTGTVYVYPSSGAGFAAATPIAGPNGQNANFGEGIAGADVNGDGYPDLVVGSPNATVSSNAMAGIVDIYVGSGTGVVTTSPLVINGAAASAFTGMTLANAGDVTNDGYVDILIGAIGKNGQVLLWEGQSGGIKASATTTWSTGDFFGHLGTSLY